MEAKALETHYAGYRFRSRLEARWAVFFDTAGIAWEYERQGFRLSDGTCYLPDFWLPAIGIWIEVKGVVPTQAERMKAILLSLQDRHDTVVVVGLPGQHEELRYGNGGNTDHAIPDQLGIEQETHNGAVVAARSARFDGSDPAACCKVPPDILLSTARALNTTIPEINPLIVDAYQRMAAYHGEAALRNIASGLDTQHKRAQ